MAGTSTARNILRSGFRLLKKQSGSTNTPQENLISSQIRLVSNNVHINTTKPLAGKVAIVTGGTKGIGYALASRLSKDGAKVAVTSRTKESLDEAMAGFDAQNLDIWGKNVHASDEEATQQFLQDVVDRWGGLDVVVSNAAVSPGGSEMDSILDSTEDMIDKIFEVNFFGPLSLVQHSVPHLVKRGGGSIVVMGTIASYPIPSNITLGPIKHIGLYRVSKAALENLSRALAPELLEKNIRINVCSPGVVLTEFARPIWENKEGQKMIDDIFTMKRPADPDDMDGTVSFLASDDSASITAETFMVCGGGVSFGLKY